MARGGRRIGAGRKPKNRTAQVFQHPSSAVAQPETSAPVEAFEAPSDLAAEARAIWLRQAQHAFANRTLTQASALAFARYCTLVVLEGNEAKSSGVGGANHRGLLKHINALELQFLLTPSGKAMPAIDLSAATVADPDEAFFGGEYAGSRA